jgi:hypothetical protein
MVSPQCLVFSAFIVCDNLVRCIKDIARGTVILFQFDNSRVREIFLKLKNIPYICSAPSVNTLIIITDYTKIAVFLMSGAGSVHTVSCSYPGIHQPSHTGICCGMIQNRRMIRKQNKRFQKQVIKNQAH